MSTSSPPPPPPPATPRRLRRSDLLIACLWAGLIALGGLPSVTAAGDDGEATAVAGPAEEGDPPELSVAPLRFPAYPEDRPAWIDQPPRMEADEQLWPVVSVPSLDRQRCRESLRTQVEIAIGQFAEESFGSAADPPTEASFTIPEAWVAEALANSPRRYEGQLETSDGEMFEAAALLRFDQAFRGRLQQAWKDQQVARRLSGLGLLGGSSFVLLIGLSFLLRCAGVRKA